MPSEPASTKKENGEVAMRAFPAFPLMWAAGEIAPGISVGAASSVGGLRSVASSVAGEAGPRVYLTV
jgi:hypothetical protein